MRNKFFWPCLFVLFCGGFLSKEVLKDSFFHSPTLAYPNFYENPMLDQRMRTLMAPFLLPLEHPVRQRLDSLFSQCRATEDLNTLKKAGFSVIAAMPGSFVIVARHSDFPGYVFKLYLDTETRAKEGIPNWEWLVKRCIGAEKIRKIIKKEKIRHFTIPDKWLYILPIEPFSKQVNPQPIIVVETDMELEDEKTTQNAWKTYATKELLNELFSILKHGYGTIGLVRNIPYTKKGTFAFTDTEYPIRRLNLNKVKPYLSEEMQQYWDVLRKKKQKTKKKNDHA